MTKATEKQGFIFVYTSTSQSITEGSKGRNSSRSWSHRCKGHGAVLLTGLLNVFIALRTTNPGMVPPTWSRPSRINHYPRKCPISLQTGESGGGFSQLISSLPKWLQPVSTWYKTSSTRAEREWLWLPHIHVLRWGQEDSKGPLTFHCMLLTLSCLLVQWILSFMGLVVISLFKVNCWGSLVILSARWLQCAS